MYTLKHKSWSQGLALDPQKLGVLILESKDTLFRYCISMLKAVEGESQDWVLLNNKMGNQNFSKLCVYEPSMSTFQLNSKKLQTALYKKCSALVCESNFEFTFKKQLKMLYDLCREVSVDVGYDIVLNEEYDTVDVFKLFSLEIKDEYPSLVLKLLAFVNIYMEFFNTKVFVFLFLTKFLYSEQLCQLHQHCASLGVVLVLIESQVPSSQYLQDIETRKLLIDEDNCEIYLD